ncbi:MAG: PIN domain-containing protein [Sedimentisphaerales bacterium]|nr:PIN domain-containing protein [Sedimentisphaerales bacterium]
MKPMRIYLDTSVLGGCFDEEFRDASRQFLKTAYRQQITPLISEILLRELAEAPRNVRNLLSRMMLADLERLEVSDDAVELHDAYLAAAIVSARHADDALHVALATVARADVLVSWNFKHLVNPARIRAFNGVNTSRGYGPIIIMTPSDIVSLLEETDETSEDL